MLIQWADQLVRSLYVTSHSFSKVTTSDTPLHSTQDGLYTFIDDNTIMLALIQAENTNNVVLLGIYEDELAELSIYFRTGDLGKSTSNTELLYFFTH